MTAIKSNQVLATIIPPDLDLERPLTDWQQIDQSIVEIPLIEKSNNQYHFSYDGFTLAGSYTVIVQANNKDGEAIPIQTIVTVMDKLTGDVNRDGTVNIFDLVIAAGNFGQTGTGMMADVNGDGAVNIFDLVIVAGKFGQSLSAPSMALEIDLSTRQKQNLVSVIDQLLADPQRSATEEMLLEVLQAILPEELPATSRLLANYPNPFNPETWIPFELSQDSVVSISIYNARGQCIRQLELGMVAAGRYVTEDKSAYWDGKTEDGEAVASGTYFYQIEAGKYTAIRKMTILK